jgi:hypothetical protein
VIDEADEDAEDDAGATAAAPVSIESHFDTVLVVGGAGFSSVGPSSQRRLRRLDAACVEVEVEAAADDDDDDDDDDDAAGGAFAAISASSLARCSSARFILSMSLSRSCSRR